MCDRQSTIHVVQCAIDNLQSTCAMCDRQSTIHVVPSAIDDTRLSDNACMHSHGTESEPVMTVEQKCLYL